MQERERERERHAHSYLCYQMERNTSNWQEGRVNLRYGEEAIYPDNIEIWLCDEPLEFVPEVNFETRNFRYRTELSGTCERVNDDHSECHKPSDIINNSVSLLGRLN